MAPSQRIEWNSSLKPSRERYQIIKQRKLERFYFTIKFFIIVDSTLHHSKPHIYALARAHFFRKQQETSMHTQTAKQCSCKNLYFFLLFYPFPPLFSCRFQFLCNKVKKETSTCYVHCSNVLLSWITVQCMQHDPHSLWYISLLFWIIIQNGLTTQYNTKTRCLLTKQFPLKVG